MALLGDASWVGREAGRGRFARELMRRMARARGDGLSMRTLALRTALPVDHCDLAIKEGIMAARHPSAAEAKRAPRLQPQALRFGLWGFPVSMVLPAASRWLPGGGGVRTARFEIDKAIAERGLVHLAIDAPHLAERVLGAARGGTCHRTRGPQAAAWTARGGDGWRDCRPARPRASQPAVAVDSAARSVEERGR